MHLQENHCYLYRTESIFPHLTLSILDAFKKHFRRIYIHLLKLHGTNQVVNVALVVVSIAS